MSGLLNVIRFEVMRNLKKPSFWIAAILIPICLVVYVAVCGMAGANMGNSLSGNVDTDNMKIAVVDDSDYLQVYEIPISEDGKETKKLEKLDDKEQGIQDVKDKKVDILYYLPADFVESGKLEVYVKPESANILDDYSQTIKTALSMQASTEVPAIDLKIITGTIEVSTTTFDAKDDHEVDMTESVNKIVAPILGIALFYFLIVILGNRIIVAMTEEKENRISELLLVGIKPNDLVVGKIISLMILGFIQLLVLVIPILILVNTDAISVALPAGFELKFDALELIKYGAFLIGSYYFFTAVCVAIGAIAPTAKDANSYSGIIMIFMILLPMIFMSSLSTAEATGMTGFLMFFPASAPLSVMLRGLFGHLQTWEYVVSLVSVFVFGTICAFVATYFFKRNAISFTSKINFKKLFGSPRKSWKK